MLYATILFLAFSIAFFIYELYRVLEGLAFGKSGYSITSDYRGSTKSAIKEMEKIDDMRNEIKQMREKITRQDKVLKGVLKEMGG